MGRTKHMRIMPGGALESEQSLSGPSSVFVGQKLDEHRGSFFLEYPMDKGHVVDGGWDAMESLWEVRYSYHANISCGIYHCINSDISQNISGMFQSSLARLLQIKLECAHRGSPCFDDRGATKSTTKQGQDCGNFL